MAELTTSAQATGRRIRWKWLLALGVVLLLLGLASAGATTLLSLTSLLVFGPLLLASSVLQVLMAFFAEEGKESLLHFLAAAPEAALAFLIMAHPLLGITDLVMLVAILLMVSGLVRLARSLLTHSPGRAWAFMAGGGALILGICVWLQVPVSGLWFVGLCIALDFICHGVSWCVVALAEGRPLEVP
jgi:uncharacterized membrane protein HdeD (DUF308 family)